MGHERPLMFSYDAINDAISEVSIIIETGARYLPRGTIKGCFERKKVIKKHVLHLRLDSETEK